MKNKKEGQRKAKRHVVCKKKTREKASPFHVRSYFTHSPFNVTYMEIVRFNSNRRFKTNISHQRNLLFYSKVKANWKTILTCYLKNWMQKDKDKWPPNHLLWKRQAHSLMKWSISFLGVPYTSMAIKIKWCLS